MNAHEFQVGRLQGRVEEQGTRMNDLREAIVGLETRMTGFETRMDARFQQVDGRFQQLEQRLDNRFAAIDQRLNSIDYKFGWFVGILATVGAGVFGQYFVR